MWRAQMQQIQMQRQVQAQVQRQMQAQQAALQAQLRTAQLAAQQAQQQAEQFQRAATQVLPGPQPLLYLMLMSDVALHFLTVIPGFRALHKRSCLMLFRR